MTDKIIELATKLSNHYRRVADQVLRERLGVTYSKYEILEQIGEGKIHPSQIAESLGKTEASISRQINLLVDEGMINRFSSSGDERYKILRITKKGGLQLANGRKVLSQYFDQKLSYLKKPENTSKDLSQIVSDLDKLST